MRSDVADADETRAVFAIKVQKNIHTYVCNKYRQVHDTRDIRERDE